MKFSQIDGGANLIVRINQLEQMVIALLEQRQAKTINLNIEAAEWNKEQKTYILGTPGFSHGEVQ